MLRLAALAALLPAALCSGCAGADDGPRAAQPLSAPRPVFLLGFDGLDPEWVERWEREGLLPHFARLRARSAVGRIRSTIPSISPPAWTTVATGVPPSAHGVWGFWLPRADDPRGRFVDAGCRLAPALWEDLSESGRSVGIVNVPVTSPPDSVKGFLISGFPYAPGAPLAWPEELGEDLRERGYLKDEYGGAPEPGREEQWLDRVREVARARRSVALNLLLERGMDLSFIVFTSPDRIQHHLWKFHDPQHPAYDPSAAPRLRRAVRDCYVWCDEVLGEVLDRLPADAVLFVLSDHGFRSAARGISKKRVLESLPPGAATHSVFGGDFWLREGDDEARAAAARTLLELRGPSGEPLVRAVHDLRAGPARGFGRERGPDLVAEEAEGFLFAPGNPSDPLVAPLPARAFSGYHRRLGYFAAHGPPVVAGELRDIDLLDVPAMTLHLLGEEIPRRYVNNVPRKLFPLAFFVERPMKYVGGSGDGLRRPEERGTPAPGDAVENQLRSLGYVQ